MSVSRRASILAMATTMAAAACGGGAPRAPSRAETVVGQGSVAAAPKPDAIDRLDPKALIGSCDVALAEPRVPAARTTPVGAGAFAVAVYTAHPDDESMYAGGVISALAAHGHKVALVLMSHGEGGRLLAARGDGTYDERRDLPWQEVTAVRDPEMTEAAHRMGAELTYLNDASQNADFGWTTSCSESLAHWEAALTGGLRGVLRRMVDDMRRRQPRVVITLDPHDDPQSSHHGHHKAVGVLAELAARLAADPGVAGTPHTVDELLTMAPADAPLAVVVPVDARARRRALDAHVSQFRPADLDGFGMRPDERFVVRWSAHGAPPTPSGSLLSALVR